MSSIWLLPALLALAASPAAAQTATAPPLDARAWALIDARSGDVLAARAPSRRLPIASATKLMTARLALREAPLRRRVPMAPYAALPVESVLGIPAGTSISFRDLLYALILRSANDAAHTIAQQVGGTEAGFVAQMNRAAIALGLRSTHFTNPIGLDAPGNYSSAGDLAKLARLLLRDRRFARIADSSEATLTSLSPPLSIATRNTLLLREPWVTGVKTGHTLGAGYVEVGSASRAGTPLIGVVLGAPSETARDLETLELLEHGFSLYRTRRPVRGGEILARAEVRYADRDLPLRAARPISAAVRSGQRVSSAVRAVEEVTGPVAKGRRLGRVTVFVDRRRVGTAPLIAAEGVPRASWFERTRSRAGVPVLIGVAAFAILALAMLARRRREGPVRPQASEEEMRSRREQRRQAREQRRDGERR